MKKRKIAIIGLGYVGLPLAFEFSKKGHDVIGIDYDENKITQLNQRRSYLSEMTDEAIVELMSLPFVATTDYEEVNQVDVILICVPTPLASTGSPNLCYVQIALNQMLPFLQEGQLLILESSTFPGTTEEIVVPIVEQGGFIVGETIFIGYSPERLDPGNKQFHLRNVPKVISGTTSNCLAEVKRLYETVFHDLIPVSSTRTAEAVKMVENTQRFINLSFVNEMARVCNELDVDVWEVLQAVETKPYGFSGYRPGPGVGGHCIPVDPLYLKWKANQAGSQTHFIDVAKAINDEQPEYIVNRVRSHLHSLDQKDILLIGLSYKKNSKDVRESKSIVVAEQLIQAGSRIAYYDPFVSTCSLNDRVYQSIDLTKEELVSFDLVVLLTDHDQLDYDFIMQHSKLIFDTRNRLNGNAPHLFTL